MEHWSYFISNKALFGSYPNETRLIELVQVYRVQYIINLTMDDECGVKQYHKQCIKGVQYFYYHLPIKDNKIPNNIIEFCSLVLKLKQMLDFDVINEQSKLYVHCRGGHGRSGLLVACLLRVLHNISGSEAISQTTTHHNMRLNMKDKWKRIGSPQNIQQRTFVNNFFKPLSCVEVSYRLNFTSNDPFQWRDTWYDSFWHALSSMNLSLNNTRLKYVKMFVDEKLKAYPDLQHKLLLTGLRPLLYFSKTDLYWGCSKTDSISGNNHFGKILTATKLKHFQQMASDLKFTYISPSNYENSPPILHMEFHK